MKTTKHKILSVLLVATLALTMLTGCSSGAGSEITTPPLASEETPEVSQEPEATPSPTEAPEAAPDDSETPDTSDSSAGGLPEYLADLTIVLEGDIINMTMPLEDFLDFGWEPSDNSTSKRLELTLEPKQYTGFHARKGDADIYVQVANLQDDQAIIARQGSVFGIEPYGNVNSTELPEGISLGASTVDDFIAAYGEDLFVDGETLKSYWQKDYSILFEIDKDSGVIRRFEISGVMYGWKSIVE